MAMGGNSTGGAALAEINVTPLVDVMLVLLIVFMVTAPMLQTGVDVDLPQAKAPTIPDDEGKLILTVTKDKRVFLGKLQIAWDDVEKTLKNNAKLNADHELYLHADKDLPYGEVVKVTVTELRENTYFARITIVQNGNELEIDSRPSDAIALAIRAKAPVYVEERVFEKSERIDLAPSDPASGPRI